MSESCNSFVLVLKVDGKWTLCLGPAGINKTLVRPIHRDPTLNNILLRLVRVKYLTLIDASSGYHNLKPDEMLSYLTMFLVNLAGTDM